MSQVKRHLEEISERLGYGGEINEAVLKAAADEVAKRLDIIHDTLRDSTEHTNADRNQKDK